MAPDSLSSKAKSSISTTSSHKSSHGHVKFGTQGEWAESRVLQVQFEHINGTDLGQFKDLLSAALRIFFLRPAPLATLIISGRR
jgi:hypothetical protein